MDNTKGDLYYSQKIETDLAFIIEHMKNVDQERLYKDEVLLDSMLFRMIQISENARKLTQGYKDEHNEIPWPELYGLRNRIVHDYGNVDLSIVYQTLKEDIPVVLDRIRGKE